MAKDFPATVVGPESVTVRVREVANGFITERSTYGADGYKCVETFSKTRPQIQVNSTSDMEEPKSGSMRQARKELRRSK